MIKCTVHVLLYKDLLSIYYVQALPQGVDALALEVVNGSLSSEEGWGEAYSRRLRFKLPSEQFITVLNHYSVTAFRVGRDVDVEADDAACIDGLLIDRLARFVCDVHQIGIVERVEVDA